MHRSMASARPLPTARPPRTATVNVDLRLRPSLTPERWPTPDSRVLAGNGSLGRAVGQRGSELDGRRPCAGTSHESPSHKPALAGD